MRSFFIEKESGKKEPTKTAPTFKTMKNTAVNVRLVLLLKKQKQQKRKQVEMNLCNNIWIHFVIYLSTTQMWIGSLVPWCAVVGVASVGSFIHSNVEATMDK